MSWATDLTQLAAHLRCTCAPEAEAACLLHERERHREFDWPTKSLATGAGGAVGVGATSPSSLPSLRLDLNIAISFKWLPQLAFEQIYWISLGAAFYICGATTTTTTTTTRYFLTAMRKMEVKSAPSKSKTNANLYPALQTRPICRSAALQWAHFKGISRMRRDAFCGFCGRTNIYIHLLLRAAVERERVIEGI